MAPWQAPPGHPISLERARELMAGELGNQHRQIIRAKCAPIYWYTTDGDPPLLRNGTVTFLQTPERLLGVTAAHVLVQYLRDSADRRTQLAIGYEHVEDLRARVVDINERLDLATFELDQGLLRRIGEHLQPLAHWPPRAPQEGRGIMLAGFPARERVIERRQIDFGLVVAQVIARSVTDTQITWLIERDEYLEEDKVPLNYGFGGISGGPLITWLESEHHIVTFALGGIIIEHPDYDNPDNDFNIERVIAIRGDFIAESGRIVDVAL